MRIVEEGVWKEVRYTVFINNQKYSLKLEMDQAEIHFKFRQSELSNLSQLRQSMTDDFFLEQRNVLQNLVSRRTAIIAEHMVDTDDLPHII